MKQALVKDGTVIVQEVPAPRAGKKNVLVRVHHSCVSVGTETASVQNSGLPLYRRALKQPEHVKKVLELMRDQGIKRTLDRVLGKLSAGLPIGYSAAGQVIALGDEVTGFREGDFVACAGGGLANHAEFIDVPINLVTRVPAGLATDVASTVTLGAISLQGVRRANPTLGESIAVVGLGILGQLTAQLLRTNGCRVIGVDVEPKRIQIARDNGMDFGIDASAEDQVERIHRLTDGFGADAVIVTAAATNNSVMSKAMRACRKKGRVVLVGDVGLDLKRSDFYSKELDFLISCSYGPGRYDAIYEEGGQDYPFPYVRWTENRNMEAYLSLLAEGRISIAKLGIQEFSIDEATEAYESLKSDDRPLAVILEYPNRETSPAHTLQLRTAPKSDGCVSVAIVGAGNFAAGTHLPNIRKLRDHFRLQCVMSRTGSNARAIADQFGASYATTDFDQVLADPTVNLVLLATRHNLHGQMALAALRAGKHTFVEKPLTLDPAHLDELRRLYESDVSRPVLMTGYNRRFSPAMKRIREELKDRASPLLVNYRMNAGYIPLDHWVHSPEGGGRNIGEACHIYDLFNFLTGSTVAKVRADCVRGVGKQYAKNDNFVATITYDDGSVCTLTYTALGNRSHPKETMEIFCDGKVISMQDYKSLSMVGGKAPSWRSASQQKGQLEELQALANCLLNGSEWPIPLEDQLAAARVAFEVEDQLKAD